MTIEVQIKVAEQPADRCVAVDTVSVTVDGSPGTPMGTEVLEPGVERSFYLHSAMRLNVREVDKQTLGPPDSLGSPRAFEPRAFASVSDSGLVIRSIL